MARQVDSRSWLLDQYIIGIEERKMCFKYRYILLWRQNWFRWHRERNFNINQNKKRMIELVLLSKWLEI